MTLARSFADSVSPAPLTPPVSPSDDSAAARD